MALSTINSTDALNYHTHAVINQSNYEQLRYYILDRKPLLAVTEPIKAMLAQHCADDKIEKKQAAIGAAFIAQKNEDSREEITDAQEREEDKASIPRTTNELASVGKQLMSLADEHYRHQNRSIELRSQISKLQSALVDVKSRIDRIFYERQTLISQYVNTVPYPYTRPGTVHTHCSSGTIHTHHNTLAYPSIGVYPLLTQLALNDLASQERELNAERARITDRMNTTEQELSQIDLKLSELTNKKKRTELRGEQLKNELEIILPQKEQQRQMRERERMVRATVRATDAQNLQQLSHKNFTSLHTQIAVQDKSLDALMSQLMHEVITNSHATYCTMLEQFIHQNSQLSVTLMERDALKTILTLQKEYIRMEQELAQDVQVLNDEKSNLARLQRQLAKGKEQLTINADSIKQLARNNQLLEHEKSTLMLDFAAASSSRATAFYITLAGASSAIISAAVLGALLVNPLFLLIPAALALGMLISLTATIIYHFQKSAAEEALDDTNKKISKNTTQSEALNQQMVELDTKSQPQLQKQLHESEETITRLEQQVADKKQEMSQVLSKAHNISGQYAPIYPFFPKPSAPRFEEVDMNNSARMSSNYTG